MIEEISLLSGNDIPFFPAKINIHQPTIKEIAYIGEESFFLGCQLLNFSKESLAIEDKEGLSDLNDFDILMSILLDESAKSQKICFEMLLSLMFPEYSISITLEKISLKKEEEEVELNRENFGEFQNITKRMFSIESSAEESYKPANAAAAKIAEKLKKGREKVAQLKGEDLTKIAILSRYISILSVGLQMDIRIFLDYTVYQLFDIFKRFQMLQSFDINLKARMAGASDLEEVDNWMEDIHKSN